MNRYCEQMDYRFNLFQSHYEKNMILYGKETSYEDMDVSPEYILDSVRVNRGLTAKAVGYGVRLGLNPYNDKSILIFEHLSFRTEQLTLFDTLLNDPEDLLDGVFFVDCRFATNYSNINPIRRNVCFRNCVFKRDLTLTDSILQECIFTDCEFYKQFSIKDTRIHGSFFIEKSRFFDESVFNMENAVFDNPQRKCVISDTMFLGPVFAKGFETQAETTFKNVVFHKQFEFKKALFGEKCLFEGFAYANAHTKEILTSKEQLAKSLKENGYETQIKKLDLSIEDNKNAKFDYEKYKIAYDSGLLNTEFTAYFLGKSVNYLARKRMADKKVITRESLPFIGEGKDLVYPVDALLAYKAKDWMQLKELRKKYSENKK